MTRTLFAVSLVLIMGEPTLIAQTNYAILSIPSNGQTVVDNDTYAHQVYLLEISGYIRFGYTLSGHLRLMDAAYRFQDGNVPQSQLPMRAGNLLVNGALLDWKGTLDGTNFSTNTYSPSHIYRAILTSDGSPLHFQYSDSIYSDNAGSFRVTISQLEHLELTLGSTVLRAGETGSVPVTLISLNPVTNVGLTMVFSANVLTNWAVQPVDSTSCSASVSNGCQLCVAFNPTNGHDFVNTQQLGQITFIAASNQPSAFLPLHITDATAALPDGTPTLRFHDGEVVVIHTNSLLRMLSAANGQPALTLYGLPGTNYTIEAATNLMPPVTWKPVCFTNSANFIMPIGDMNMTNSAMFFRARQ